jgi:outer membrane lipoprotein-sorting protein
MNTSSRFVVAIHILAILGWKKMYFNDFEGMKSEDLAESVNTNPVFIRRLMGKLSQAGLVKTKSGPFMGSEFAYEDISSQEVEKYTYKYINDDTHEGQACFIIERYPVDEESGYSRQVVWMDKDHYRYLKIDFYDRKNDLLKTLTYHDYKLYLDKFWRSSRMAMINHQTGKSTDLLWENYEFSTGLSDSDFNQNTLKRVR